MFIHGNSSTTDTRREVEVTDHFGVSSRSAAKTDGVIEVANDFTIEQEDRDSTFVVNTDPGDVNVVVDPDEFPLKEHFKIQVVNGGSGAVNISADSGSLNTAGPGTNITDQYGHVTVRHLKDGDFVLFGDLSA